MNSYLYHWMGIEALILPYLVCDKISVFWYETVGFVAGKTLTFWYDVHSGFSHEGFKIPVPHRNFAAHK